MPLPHLPPPEAEEEAARVMMMKCFQPRLLDQRGADRPRGCTNVLATYGAEVS